jgi:phosphoribosylglycinamide formyltransferase-1
MTDEFIGDPLTPDAGTFDAGMMARGEPGLPRRFTWRGESVEIRATVRSWKETGPCSHGSGEHYVKKHWFEVQTNQGTLMIYFERQPRGGPRWWLFKRQLAAV